MSEDASNNTDRELWREVPGDAYAPSIHVTADGGIGINCGGEVFVAPVTVWHKWAQQDEAFEAKLADEEGMARALYDVNHVGPVSHPSWEAQSDDCKLVYRHRARKMIAWLKA